MSFFHEIVDQSDSELAMPRFVETMKRYACGNDTLTALETIAAKLALQSKDGRRDQVETDISQVAYAKSVVEKSEEVQLQHVARNRDGVRAVKHARLCKKKSQTEQRLHELHVHINQQQPQQPQQHQSGGECGADAWNAFQTYLTSCLRSRGVFDKSISVKHLRWLVAVAEGRMKQRELLQDALAKVETEYKTYAAVARELFEQQRRVVEKRAHLIEAQGDSPLRVGVTAIDRWELETARLRYEASRKYNEATIAKIDQESAQLEAKINQLKCGYVSSSSSSGADCSGAHLSDEQPNSTDAQLLVAGDETVQLPADLKKPKSSWKNRILRFFRCGSC